MILYFLYNYRVTSSVGNDAVVNWLFEVLETSESEVRGMMRRR